jgi:spermidine/putrescine transport system permease protein
LVSALPVVILIVGARLERLDMTVIEAARDCGAAALVAFRRILAPQIAPALIGSGLLAAAWSLDEFAITLLTNGGTTTVPVYIFGLFRFGIIPAINAIAITLLRLLPCWSLWPTDSSRPRILARPAPSGMEWKPGGNSRE